MSVIINDTSKTLIRKIPYFETLTDAAVAQVAGYIITRHYRAGEIIFLEKDSNAGLHLVVSGSCKVYRLSEEGREQILTLLRPGDSCNEVPLVDNGPNPANLIAIEDSEVWVISSEALIHLRAQYPALNDAIIQNLAMRCRQLVRRIHHLSFLPVTGRLAAFLLRHSEAGELSRDYWTQDEIAAYLGTVREMVARALKELQQSGLIEIERHRVIIIDPAGLRKLT